MYKGGQYHAGMVPEPSRGYCNNFPSMAGEDANIT